MEWVEVQGKTIELAVEVAMGELGASNREDVEVEIIQEPSAGFLGMGGKEAIVKVTKAPRKRRRRGGRGRKGGNGPDAGAMADTSDGSRSSRNRGDDRSMSQKSKATPNRTNAQRQESKVSNQDDRTKNTSEDPRPEQAPIEEQATVAADFVSGLLDAFGLEGSVATNVDDEILYIDVQGAQTEALVGQKGAVMQSVLELTRTVVQRKTYGAPRMRIDIAGYSERRREALKIYASKLSAQVIEDKGEVMLEAMNAADRKVLHDAIAEIDGVRSYSEGEEPRRAVVIAYDGEG
jgi:spoIIIJ-associated protein